MDKEILIILVTWFASGLFSLIATIILDMRGKDYDESYFDNSLGAIIIIILLGYISIPLAIICYFSEKDIQGGFTRLVYKISNIGIKRKENERAKKEENKTAVSTD